MMLAALFYTAYLYHFTGAISMLARVSTMVRFEAVQWQTTQFPISVTTRVLRKSALALASSNAWVPDLRTTIRTSFSTWEVMTRSFVHIAQLSMNGTRTCRQSNRTLPAAASQVDAQLP